VKAGGETQNRSVLIIGAREVSSDKQPTIVAFDKTLVEIDDEPTPGQQTETNAEDTKGEAAQSCGGADSFGSFNRMLYRFFSATKRED
jgi:hypothetical protein